MPGVKGSDTEQSCTRAKGCSVQARSPVLSSPLSGYHLVSEELAFAFLHAFLALSPTHTTLPRPPQQKIPFLQTRKARPGAGKLPARSWWQSGHALHPKGCGSPLPPAAPRSARLPRPQVWFQNRRAKFRRNERAMLANRSASLLKSYSQEAAIEQPVAPRPTALSPDYLSWTASSPYR